MRTWSLVVLLAVAVLSAGCGGSRVPPGFTAKPGTTPEPYTNTGWAKEIIHDKTGIEMVFIPAGEFLMKSPTGEKERSDPEGPFPRLLTTKAFYLGKCEVTQQEWDKVMGDNPSRFKGSARLPVEQVSWEDCQNFCGRAVSGLRLPTQAEWEYACRAGSRRWFCFGDDDATLGEYAWYLGNSGEKTHEVGQKRPNAWGLYDIHGNVREWCSDWTYWPGANGGGDAVDPLGPANRADRVLRGGGWIDPPYFCGSAHLFWRARGVRASFLGFRLARDLE